MTEPSTTDVIINEASFTSNSTISCTSEIQVNQTAKFDGFCAFPFQHLCLGNEGTARICCTSPYTVSKDGAPMSLYTSTFEDIWNSQYMREVRRKILNGERVAECEVCYAQEAATSTSYRTSNGSMPLPGQPVDIDALQAECAANNYCVDTVPGFLKLELGNVCNLKCRMCYGGNSSEIERDPVHTKWSGGADPLHAIWVNNQAIIGPEPKIGVKRHGVYGREMANDQWVCWTEASASFNVPLSVDRPPHLLIIEVGCHGNFDRLCCVSINGEIRFQGTVDRSSTKLYIDLNGLTQCNDLTIDISSDVAFNQQTHRIEGVPLVQLTLHREGSSDADHGGELLKSRIPTPQLWYKNDEVVFKELLANNGNLRRLFFTGGEPFLEPRFAEILDFLIERNVAQNIQLEVTTNGTVIKERLLERIKRFKSSFLSISLDGIGAVQEYIRYPLKWDKVQKNIGILRDYGFRLKAVPVLQAYNMLYLADIHYFVAQMDIDISYSNILQYPTWLRMSAMPADVHRAGAQKLKEIFDENRFEGPGWVRDQVNALIGNFESFGGPHNPADLRTFNLFTNDLDVTRGQRFRDSLPELYELIEQSGYEWTDSILHAAGKSDRLPARKRVHAWL
jgi:glutamate-1-semialdehyde 2,1-aminomutase